MQAHRLADHFTIDELRSLHERRSSQVWLRLSILIGLWVGLGALAHRADHVAGRLALWIIIGFVLTGLVQLWHDGWHGTLFRSRSANNVLSIALSTVFFVMDTPAREIHLTHHKHNRTPLDPDAYNLGRKSLRLYLQFYNIVLLGPTLAPLHFNFVYPFQNYERARLPRHFAVLSLYALFYVILAWLVTHAGLWSLVVDVWLFPFLAAGTWAGIKSITDHYHNVWRGDVFHTATTTITHPFISFLLNGMNYHLDHHLFPQIPGYNLPRVHDRLAPTFAAEQATVYRGYGSVIYRSLRDGPTFIDEDTLFTTRSLAELKRRQAAESLP